MSQYQTKFKVAAVQTTPVFMDRDATIDKACGLIVQAAGQGASLVVFPEAFVSGYPDWVWVLPPAQKAMINDLYREMLNSAVSIPDNSVDAVNARRRQLEDKLVAGQTFGFGRRQNRDVFIILRQSVGAFWGSFGYIWKRKDF